jgi:hypothetical protein
MASALSGHQRLDQRSRALYGAIACKLRADPSLLDIARQNLDRWSAQNGRSQPYWDAWRKLIDGPFENLLALMTEDSERMTAMRQASPFAGVLSPPERWAIYDSFSRPSSGSAQTR